MLKDKKFIYSLAISVVLHIAVLISFHSPEKPEEKPQPPIEVTLGYPEPETQFLDQLIPTEVGIPCPDSYVGVGFKYRLLSDIITDVAPNSPAETMGIKVGDRIITMTDNKGKSVGEKFQITIERDGLLHSFSALTEDICTKK